MNTVNDVFTTKDGISVEQDGKRISLLCPVQNGLTLRGYTPLSDEIAHRGLENVDPEDFFRLLHFYVKLHVEIYTGEWTVERVSEGFRISCPKRPHAIEPANRFCSTQDIIDYFDESES